MITDYLRHLDESITLGINSLNLDLTDPFWELMSNTKVWAPLYAIILVFFFLRLGWKKAIIVILSVALVIVACDQFANFIKDLVARLRPCYNSDMINGGLHILESRRGMFGFFSAHSANAFGFAISTLRGFRIDKTHTYNAYAKWAYVWAFLVAVSRIFVGKHFLGDVVVGAFVGLAFGWLISELARRIIAKISSPAAL